MKQDDKEGESQPGTSSKRSGSPPIGGIRSQSRYGTFGGGVQESKSLDSQTPEPLNAQAFESLNAQTSEKRKRRRRTVYLELDVDQWVRERVAKSEEEMSGVVNEALRALMRNAQ